MPILHDTCLFVASRRASGEAVPTQCSLAHRSPAPFSDAPGGHSDSIARGACALREGVVATMVFLVPCPTARTPPALQHFFATTHVLLRWSAVPHPSLHCPSEQSRCVGRRDVMWGCAWWLTVLALALVCDDRRGIGPVFGTAHKVTTHSTAQTAVRLHLLPSVTMLRRRP
jgi:hypothetical protein